MLLFCSAGRFRRLPTLYREYVDHVSSSVSAIREFLVAEIGELPQSDTDVRPHLMAMAAACRKCLTELGPTHRRLSGMGMWAEEMIPFGEALGDFRTTIGIHAAQFAVKFGLDVDDDLARVAFPPAIDTGDEASDIE